MATIWTNKNDEFVATTCSADNGSLESQRAVRDALGGMARIVPFRDGARQNYALIAGSNVMVRVDGLAIVDGFHVLRHKEAIAIGSQRFFFSAHSQPVVELYQPDEHARPLCCPVCRVEFQPGDQVVSCPGCTRLHHQISASGDVPEKCCWTYLEKCRFCDHPTSLSDASAWQPHETDEIS